MAARPLMLIFTVFGRLSTALQVTPNSPCASFCVDSNDLDFSDPNSSNAKNKDIICYDEEYTSTPVGQKFTRCMSCLQDSSFSQGNENDQAWFLYNLRYTVDYCIFAYPNASGVSSTPCSTSTACGGLEVALTGDELDASGLEPYEYCDADGAAMSGPSMAKCQACVGVMDGQDYLANFMVALDAGCQQRPEAGTAVGLNDTIFSSTLIGVVNPTPTAASSTSKSGVSSSTIIGIVAGVIVVTVIGSVILFVCHRKRRNRCLRLQGSPNPNNLNNHSNRSPLSFPCHTHLTPRSPPNFYQRAADSSISEKKQYIDPGAALGSHPMVSESPVSRRSVWSSQSSFRSERYCGNAMDLPFHNITTSAPKMPSNVHYSTSPKAKGFSPTDDMVDPQSTTSTKSTSQLLPLKLYNPANYGMTMPQMGSVAVIEVHHSSPTSNCTARPLISPVWQQRRSEWDKPLPSMIPKRPEFKEVVNIFCTNKPTKWVSSSTGSPVETKDIIAQFAAPPPGRKAK